MSSPGRGGMALRMVRAVIVIALAVAYFGFVLRLHRGDWLTSGLGDWIDPYLINSLLEQWQHSLTHFTDPASPPMFYPSRRTLGYSVGLVLYVPFYLVTRVFLHPFPAYTLALFLMLVTGAVCLYVLLRRFMSLGVIEALLITAMFATSPNVMTGSTFIWAQMASVFLIPPILLAGLTSLQWPAGRKRTMALALSGFAATLLLTQDVYTGVLAALVGALLLVGAWRCLGWPAVTISATRRPRRLLAIPRRVASWIVLSLVIAAAAWAWIDARGSLFGITIESHHHRWERPAAVAAVMFAIWLALRGIRTRIQLSVPKWTTGGIALATGAIAGICVFLYVYSAAFLQHPGFPMDQLMQSLVPWEPGDLRGRFTHPGDILPYPSERTFAVVFLLMALAWVPWFGLRRQTRVAALWFGLISILVVLIAIRVRGMALWQLVIWLPGFSAIRDPKRIIYIYELAAALMLGLFLMELPRASILRRSVSVGLVAMLIVTWTVPPVGYLRPIDVFTRWVTSPIAVDPACRSFFIKGASAEYMARSGHMSSLYGIDSMFLATQYGLPTLNGYSAWGPPGWDLTNPQIDEYPGLVSKWIEQNHLRDVCALDIDARTMTPFRAPAGSPIQK